MRLHHEMTVPATPDDVWRALGEVDEVAPCLPGAAVDLVDDETIYGSMSVKAGPLTMAYKGHAVIDERDDAHHRMVVHATGREQHGVGTARATMIVALHDRGAATELDVDTDLILTGNPARLGRGVMTELGNGVIAEFADRLTRRLSARTAAAGAAGETAGQAAATAPGTAATDTTATDTTATRPHGSTALSASAPLDLWHVLLPMLRRAALLAALALVLALVERRLTPRHGAARRGSAGAARHAGRSGGGAAGRHGPARP